MDFRNFRIPYTINPQYSKKAVYFSMEFALEQVLKIYSGGLGFLAGSHMKSAYNLKAGSYWNPVSYGNLVIMTGQETTIRLYNLYGRERCTVFLKTPE